VRRLLLLAIPSRPQHVREHLTQTRSCCSRRVRTRNVNALFDDCLVAAVDAGVRLRRPDGILWTKRRIERPARGLRGPGGELIGAVATVSAIWEPA